MKLKLFWMHIKNVWAAPTKQHLLEKKLLEAHQRVDRLSKRVKGLEDLMKEHLVIGADVGAGPRDVHYALVIGRYRGHDYVRTFALEGDQFTHIVDSLRSIYRQHGRSKMFVDAPPHFAQIIRRELDRDR